MLSIAGRCCARRSVKKCGRRKDLDVKAIGERWRINVGRIVDAGVLAKSDHRINQARINERAICRNTHDNSRSTRFCSPRKPVENIFLITPFNTKSQAFDMGCQYVVARIV